MHIGFMLIPYQQYTGAGEYYQHLIQEIVRLDSVNKYSVFFPSDADTAIFEKNKNVTCIRTPIHSRPGPLRYMETMLTEFINNYKPAINILHCFNFPLPNFHKGKIVLTIYDLREEDLPESCGVIHRLIMGYIAPAAIKKANYIITISKFSQKRLEAHYPISSEKSTAISIAVDTSEILAQSSGQGPLRSRPYLFAIGQIAPHKNFANLIFAFNILLNRGCDYDLVIAGHNFRNPEFVKKLHGLSVDKNRVIFTGRLSNQDKISFLKHAKLFVFPSLYEGFGIPILEAFTLQTPQAVSRIPVFEEIFGFSDAMFDPKSPADIANVIEKICKDQSLQDKIVSHGRKKLAEFTWEKTARATLNVYNILAIH
jgi:glycosyltransferase involved in cell wall biosynthesis